MGTPADLPSAGAAASGPVHVVGSVLRDYASRGVLSAMREARTRGGTAFDFGWLYDQPYTLLCDAGQGRLSLVDLLPRVERHSMMHREIVQFLKARAAADVPAHRRVDPDKASLAGTLRKGALTLELTVRSGAGDAPDFDYGARKLINIGHELFLYLNEYWPDYMWENFRINFE